MRPHPHHRLRASALRVLGAFALSLASLSCGGDGGGDSATEPDNAVAYLTLDPHGLTLLVGTSETLEATVLNASGDPLSTVNVRWTTLNPFVATVSSSGTVNANAVGATKVIAADGSKADTVDVIVTNPFTLAINPPSASVQVGGVFTFSVIARDASGKVVATPTGLVWHVGTSSVATVVSGVSLGLAVGVTTITVSAGTVTSPPATLTVTKAGATCDGISSVTKWHVDLSYTYAQSLTNANAIAVVISQSANIKADLTPVNGVSPTYEWEGTITGIGAIHDVATHKNSTPQVVESITGSGPLLAGDIFNLTVDPETCRYEFSASSRIMAVYAATGAGSGPLEEAIGGLTGSDVLGAWRLGLSDFDAQFDAHYAIGGLDGAGKNYYFPNGFGSLLWAPPDITARGAAIVTYTITKQ